MEKYPRIVVVGGGVNGVGSAIAILKEFPYCKLTLYAENITPNTTGDGAAGIWGPAYITDTDQTKILEWSQITWNLFHSWLKKGDPGVLVVPVTRISKEELGTPYWSHIPFGYRNLSQNELIKYGSDYKSGYTFSALVAEPTAFLPSFLSILQSMGGMIKKRKIITLLELRDEADIIINCSGLGAHDIVPDPNVYPIRGQLIRVKAPWITTSLFDDSEDSFSYIIPNSNSIALGGTHQDNDWRTNVDQYDKQTIWRNCLKAMPTLKNAEIIKDWVGLRPARKGGLRLELDEIDTGYKKIPVVHNYGHGGSGITLFWGCAKDVTEIVGNILHKYHSPVAFSKL